MKVKTMNRTLQNIIIYPSAFAVVMLSASYIENIGLIVPWVFFFMLIEIPLHEFIHGMASRSLKEPCVIDLKHSFLNRLFKIKRVGNKPRNPYCRMINQVQAHKIIIVSLAPVIVLVTFWIILWGVSRENTVLFFLFITVGTAFSDFYYVAYTLVNHHKGNLYKDEGSTLIIYKTRG